MSTIRMLELAQKLANQFSQTIRSSLTPEQMVEVVRRNQTYSAGTCATHDFRDANIDMADAFTIVMGLVPNPADPTHAAIWSAAWEMARNGNFAIPPAVAPDVHDELPTTFADIRISFPGLKPWPTGEGCYALRLVCDDGSYILVTQRESPKVPADDADEVDVARYAANGGVAEAACSISVETLEAWLDAALSCATDSKTIAEYFFKKLGALHPDHSFTELPVDSPCGQDCVMSIDAAAALLTHVRAAFGAEGDRQRHSVAPNLESGAIEITTRIVSVYWRG